MDFINKIGQRKVAKIIFFLSIIIGIIDYIARYFLNEKIGIMEPMSVLAVKGTIGITFMAASTGFLSLAAHKTKDYRMASIFLALFILILNTILFNLRINLLYLTVGEIMFSLVFLIFVVKQEDNNKKEDRRLKKKITEKPV